jgi:hypothetical protein
LRLYDGAQGTDVACLVRRLGARLGDADAICPVGTSATVSGGADTTQELLDFAHRVFDHPFAEDALIGETRLSAAALFEGSEADGAAPLPAGDVARLLPDPQEEAEAHVRTVVKAWFPGDAALARAAGDDLRVQLGEAVLRHPLARALVRTAGQRLAPWETLCRELRAGAPALRGERRGPGAAAVPGVRDPRRDAVPGVAQREPVERGRGAPVHDAAQHRPEAPRVQRQRAGRLAPRRVLQRADVPLHPALGAARGRARRGGDPPFGDRPGDGGALAGARGRAALGAGRRRSWGRCGWMARVVPPVLEVLQREPPERQWLANEIFDDLRESVELPEWLGHWHLAALLRKSGRLRQELGGIAL